MRISKPQRNLLKDLDALCDDGTCEGACNDGWERVEYGALKTARSLYDKREPQLVTISDGGGGNSRALVAHITRAGRAVVGAMRDRRDKRETKLEAACALVEKFVRSIGNDCSVVFVSDRGRGIGRGRSACVSVAPASWSGDTRDKTLYKALMRASDEKHDA